MSLARPTTYFALLAFAVLAGCGAGPSRSEALEALREARPGFDTTTAYARVWQDGPPWFSCAEVISKLDGRADRAAVRDQVGNWRHLVVTGWLVLRDTARGVVSDPGWCAGKLTDEAARLARGWVPIAGDSFPTGSMRRGWTVPIGRRTIVVVSSPRVAGADSAVVEYATTITVNASGAAMRADLDSGYGAALLRRIDGRWRFAGEAPRAQPAPRLLSGGHTSPESGR